jgi:hypothetical protein
MPSLLQSHLRCSSRFLRSDRSRKTMLQTLHEEWENLAFKPGEDVDDFAVCLNTL